MWKKVFRSYEAYVKILYFFYIYKTYVHNVSQYMTFFK